MFSFLMVVELLVSILLIVVVLMQSSKGGGLAGTFGGGSVGMVFGVRRTADFLTRATQILASSFIILALLINIFFLPRSGSQETESVLQRGASQQQAAPSPTVPQLPPQSPVASPEPGK